MLNWIENDIAAFVVSVVLSGLLIPQILHIAYRKNLFDDIGERKVHNGAVPRLGGIAFLPSILFSIALVTGLNMLIQPEPDWRYWPNLVQILFLTCGSLLMFLIGIADDLIGVRYRAKFFVQILCALLIVVSGVTVSNLGGLLWIWEIPDWLSWVFTIFIVVFIVNSENLIDGIDGLASGLSIIAFIFYAVLLYMGGLYEYSILACATLGTLIPFFYFNVFGNERHRKKIFMGDTGSLTIGAIVAFVAIAMTRIPEVKEVGSFNPVVVAFSPLIIQSFDVVRVYIHRVRRNRNPFLPDRSHIHHKLLALGLNQRSALAIILASSLVFMVSNVLLSPYVECTWLVAGDIVVWSVANVLLTRGIKRREAALGMKLYD